MNICCRESLEPSIKLSKMINLLKVIAIVYFVLIIADIFLFKTSLFFLLLFQLLVLLFTILKKDYGYFLFFILICLMYILQYLENVVKRFKYGINHGGELALAFCYSVLLFVLQVFSIFYTYKIYKQAKHEMKIKLGYIQDDQERVQVFENNEEVENGEGNQNNNENNENNNQGEFQPFQGHGVVVGGGDNQQ